MAKAFQALVALLQSMKVVRSRTIKAFVQVKVNRNQACT